MALPEVAGAAARAPDIFCTRSPLDLYDMYTMAKENENCVRVADSVLFSTNSCNQLLAPILLMLFSAQEGIRPWRRLLPILLISSGLIYTIALPRSIVRWRQPQQLDPC